MIMFCLYRSEIVCGKAYSKSSGPLHGFLADEEDRSNGFWMPVFDQLAYACDIIKNDPNLQDGYHGLGFSQGSQFLRGIAQTCPEPPMINLG